MSSFLSMKAVRLLLSVSVSIWMAGGCLFGCSNTAAASEIESEVPTVVAGESCHEVRSHDCCSSPKPKKQVAKTSAPSSKVPATLPFVTPSPRGMMDCPLVMNATAVVSKGSGHLPDPGRAPVAAMHFVENKVQQSDAFLAVPVVPNRGPTHLRCCVFLI